VNKFSKYFLQKIGIKKKDKNFYVDKTKELRDKIISETPWLSARDNLKGEWSGLHFSEQAIKYYEYKNMIIQRRAQYIIILLTLTLLLMTGLQIYLNFF
jgi:hypothetical protein